MMRSEKGLDRLSSALWAPDYGQLYGQKVGAAITTHELIRQVPDQRLIRSQ